MNNQNENGTSCPVFPKQGKRAVVLCDGPPPVPGILEYWLGGAELFVCTDAAGRPYAGLPRIPDVVIGDFDTLARSNGTIEKTTESTGACDRPQFIHLTDQDTTDAEKALLHAVDAGCEEAILLGATGRRVDHTLYNCSLLERFADTLRVCVAGYRDEIVRLDASSPACWQLPVGTPFSILPLRAPAAGVTVTGAKFPINAAIVEVGGPATISNQTAERRVKISVTDGSLLVTVGRTWPMVLKTSDPDPESTI